METYRRYKGYGISSTLPHETFLGYSWFRTWYVLDMSFNTRQQARDYINNLIKESHGNTPAGIQNTVSTEKQG